MTSPGLIPISLRLVSSTRCRMSGAYPISSRHRSYNRAFGTPRWVSAYSRNQRSFEGVFVTGESAIEEAFDSRDWVGVVGNWWEDCVWAIDAKLERICEIDAKVDPSDKGMWLGVGVGVTGGAERWLGTIEDLRFTGSNVCVFGGLLDDVVPSYCNQRNEIITIEDVYECYLPLHGSTLSSWTASRARRYL